MKLPREKLLKTLIPILTFFKIPKRVETILGRDHLLKFIFLWYSVLRDAERTFGVTAVEASASQAEA